MKKLNKKGFTLIELLAVIVIMGILMLVAIPAVSRTIENSRRSTFVNTAKTYVNAIKNSVAADELECKEDPASSTYTLISGCPANTYYYTFDSNGTTGTDLVEQGGKSSWANKQVKGYITIKKEINPTTGKQTYTYGIQMFDADGHGFLHTNESDLTNKTTQIKVQVQKTSSSKQTITSALGDKIITAYDGSVSPAISYSATAPGRVCKVN